VSATHANHREFRGNRGKGPGRTGPRRGSPPGRPALPVPTWRGSQPRQSVAYRGRVPRLTNPSPGRRILVYGVTGSGKSTAAQRIAERTGLPLTLVDELTWAPGWVPVAEDEQRRVFAAVAGQDRWVLDTAYGAWLDVVLPRVELVVGLDYPRWFSLQRLIRRAVTRAIDKKPICNGNTESFQAMLGRDSIIGWHFQSFSRKRGRMRAWAADAGGPAVLLFRRPGDLEAWIDTLGDGQGNAATAPIAEDGTERVDGSRP
jgi:adenylate kinase family enzyme